MTTREPDKRYMYDHIESIRGSERPCLENLYKVLYTGGLECGSTPIHTNSIEIYKGM